MSERLRQPRNRRPAQLHHRPGQPGHRQLRLTNATTGRVGGLFGAVSVPTSQGLDVTFNSYQYGGAGPTA
ncbi:hypothetical protein ACFQX6_35115 [Streptosporangium lutulentum]